MTRIGTQIALALATGIFAGAFVWLWVNHGSKVFLVYVENVLAWCL